MRLLTPNPILIRQYKAWRQCGVEEGRLLERKKGGGGERGGGWSGVGWGGVGERIAQQHFHAHISKPIYT